MKEFINKIKEKFNQNKNEMYGHSLGIMFLTICVVLNGMVELSFILYGISIVLLCLGKMYNEHKRTQQMVKKLIRQSREDIIYERMYDFEKDGQKVKLHKGELLNEFMKSERFSKTDRSPEMEELFSKGYVGENHIKDYIKH